MTESVVGLSLDRIGEDLVGLVDRRKLRAGPIVVVDVGMVGTDFLAVSLLDLVLGGVGRNVEKVVEVVSHGTGTPIVVQ
nr:hypothetical protein [Halopiger goleimassiliensis]